MGAVFFCFCRETRERESILSLSLSGRGFLFICSFDFLFEWGLVSAQHAFLFVNVLLFYILFFNIIICLFVSLAANGGGRSGATGSRWSLCASAERYRTARGNRKCSLSIFLNFLTNHHLKGVKGAVTFSWERLKRGYSYCTPYVSGALSNTNSMIAGQVRHQASHLHRIRKRPSHGKQKEKITLKQKTSLKNKTPLNRGQKLANWYIETIILQLSCTK